MTSGDGRDLGSGAEPPETDDSARTQPFDVANQPATEAVPTVASGAEASDRGSSRPDATEPNTTEAGASESAAPESAAPESAAPTSDAPTEAPPHPDFDDAFPDDVPRAAPSQLPAAAADLLPLAPASTAPTPIDELFDDTSFKDYGPAPVVPPPVAPRPVAPARSSAPIGRGQTTMMWVVGSAVAVLAIVALFFVGMRFGGMETTATEPTPTATPEPDPEPTFPLGPVAPGTYAWTELEGGECLTDYLGPWAEEFTVVDCADPHSAQLVALAPFDDQDPDAIYPGNEEMQRIVRSACRADGIVDLDAAGSIRDLQIAVSYPASGADYDDMPRLYSCFATRASGEAMTVDIAGPRQEQLVEKARAAQEAAEDVPTEAPAEGGETEG